MLKSVLASAVVGGCLLGASVACVANDAGSAWVLPKPHVSGGMPVMEAIGSRRSVRVFDMDKAIEDAKLSDLLWSAWGISDDTSKRTVPTALNKQGMELYVVKAEGVWRYEAKDNALVRISDKDWRVGQMKQAPVTFVYAGADQKFADMHAGSMYQNAGICAASLGIGNVVIYSPVEQLVKDSFPVSAGYHVVVAQSFGYPKN